MKRKILWKLLLLIFLPLNALAGDYHFNLQGPEGKEYSEKSFANKYLLIYFGFTSCPDVCPTTMYEFKNTLQLLSNPEDIQMIFITIDPLNDDATRLNAYTNYFDKRILGLTGDLQQINEVAKKFNATFGYTYQGKEVTPPDLPAGYTSYHSTFVYLLSPRNEIIDIYDYFAGAKVMAEGIQKAIAKDRENK